MNAAKNPQKTWERGDKPSSDYHFQHNIQADKTQQSDVASFQPKTTAAFTS